MMVVNGAMVGGLAGAFAKSGSQGSFWMVIDSGMCPADSLV